MATQTDHILRHLKSLGNITPVEALRDYGCFRLGARIYDLRRAGHEIETELVAYHGKRFASYLMARP